MRLVTPGNTTPDKVLSGDKFNSGINYGAIGTMPLKSSSNGDAGSSANHHNHKGIEAHPGVLYVRPVAPTDPTTAFQGDVWIRVPEANLNPAYWRSDVTMFGLQGTIPVRGAGGTVTPGPTAQTKPAGYWSTDITVAGVSVPAGAVLVGNTIAGTAGTMPNRSAQNIHLPANESTVWSGDRVFLQPPLGYYDGSTWVTAAAPQFVASNIRNGVTILGLTGNMVEGKRYATGSVAAPGSSLTINGLGFDPYIVTVGYYSAGDYYVQSGINGRWLWAAFQSVPGGSWKYGGYGEDAWTNNGFTLSSITGASLLVWQAWET